MKIVNSIKDYLNIEKTIMSEKIIGQIIGYKVISFDVFDTLLKRNVERPSDVFRYMKSIFPNFSVAKRIEAEKIARQKKKANEITLQAIYNLYGDDSYIKAELKAESELLIANIDLLPIYRKCVKEKEVVLISDMYLPEEFLHKILLREGITGYSKLFLSSSVNKTKKNGELFKYVLSELNIDKKDIVHIGDSIKSDYKIPRSLGINAIHIPTHVTRSTYKYPGNKIEVNMLNSFLNNTIITGEDAYYKFGYEKFGPFLWGFSKWLYKSLNEKDINNVYFFSRDGFIMKEAFEKIYGNHKINIHYLEVSRRSLRVPILWLNYDLEHVVNMISPSKLITLRTIFDGIGLNIEDYTKLIYKYGFSQESLFDRKEILKHNRFQKLYKELSNDIEKISKSEYELLVKYIKQNNIKGKFAIVDIGWSGGMQRYLDETLSVLGIEHNIEGYYIGVADYYKRNMDVLPNMKLNGYLFDFANDKEAIDKRNSFVGLFETLFLEKDGSVQNYLETEGKIIANRLPYEYIESGQPTHEYLSIQMLQNGALKFIDKLPSFFEIINIKPEVLFNGIEQTGLRPNKDDLNMFANFRFFDEGETHKLAEPKSFMYYATHIKQLENDFLLSRWKIGFMKKLLKVNLPYEQIYKMMLKFR